MKKGIMIIFLSSVLLLAGCTMPINSIKQNGEKKDKPVQDIIDHSKDSRNINLDFIPVLKKELVEGAPKKEWIKGKSIYFGKLPEQIEVTVHLYLEKDPDRIDADRGIVYGFLEHSGKTYEIGEVSGYGIGDVKVGLVDRTSDQIKEIEINGGLGAAYVEMKIIGYDEFNKKWMNLLTMGSPQILDLDEDGEPELLAVSMGSLPSFVNIYRWNQNHFEGASVTDATGNTYANLTNQEGKWTIESGEWEKSSVEEPEFFTYEKGRLIKQM